MCSGTQRCASSVLPKNVSKTLASSCPWFLPSSAPCCFHSTIIQTRYRHSPLFVRLGSLLSLTPFLLSFSQAHLVLLALFCSLFRLCVLASRAWQDHSAAFLFVLKIPLGNVIQTSLAQS